MEEPYTKREIDNFMVSIHEKLDDIASDIKEVKSDGKETKEQAFKTNGRVSKLEWWRSGIIWAGGVVGSICLLFIPIFLNAMKEQKKEFIEVQQQVMKLQQTLLNYDFEILD